LKYYLKVFYTTLLVHVLSSWFKFLALCLKTSVVCTKMCVTKAKPWV